MLHHRSTRHDGASRTRHRGAVCTDVSATYTKTYRTTHLSASRQRFSSHGYRVATNAESVVTASFTGSLTNTDVAPSPLTAPNFQAYIRYYNVQLSTHKHILATTGMTLPWSTGVSGGADYYVPVPLTGSVSLAPGIYQFDVFVVPVGTTGLPATLSDSDSSSGSSCSSGSSGSSVSPSSIPYAVDGSGTLSIQIVRKAL